MVKAPLKWLGGKYYLASWIIKHFPKHEIYVEPFGGMAHVLFQKPRSKVEVYNDIKKFPVQLFRVLQDKNKFEALKEQLQEHAKLLSREYVRQVRLEIAKLFRENEFDESQQIELVAEFLLAMKFSYSGRVDRAGPAWTPNNIKSFKNLPSKLDAIHKRLQGVIIENLDFEEVMRKYDSPQTLFYLDPPYLADSVLQGRYYGTKFLPEEHERLLNLLEDVRGKVALSGYDNELYRERLKGWYVVKKEVAKYSANHQTYREKPRAVEHLWLNYKPFLF